MKKFVTALGILAGSVAAFVGSITGAQATICPAVNSCTAGGETFDLTQSFSASGLTLLAVWNQTPNGQDPASISASALAFLTAENYPNVLYPVQYLGRAGDSSTFFSSDSVSVTGNGNSTGTWSFSPGTTNDVAAFVVIHSGEGQTDYLLQIIDPGFSGSFTTPNGHGLSNFDLIGYDPPPAKVPEPMTLSLLGAGLAGAAALRRRKVNKA